MTARDRIKDILNTEFKGSEFFLVDVKQSGSKYQVFIDSDNTLNIAKCAEISRLLEHTLEEEGLVPEKYVMEVSSPGMTNPLKHARQYKKRIGQVLDIYTTENQHHKGMLKQVREDGIVLQEDVVEKKKIIDKKEVKLLFNNIKKATLIFSFK